MVARTNKNWWRVEGNALAPIMEKIYRYTHSAPGTAWFQSHMMSPVSFSALLPLSWAHFQTPCGSQMVEALPSLTDSHLHTSIAREEQNKIVPASVSMHHFLPDKVTHHIPEPITMAENMEYPNSLSYSNHTKGKVGPHGRSKATLSHWSRRKEKK